MEVEVCTTETMEQTEEETKRGVLLCNDLGLSRQNGFWMTDGKPASMLRPLTSVEERVYGILLKHRVQISAFDTERIPVRLLEAVQVATEKHGMTFFEVWHDFQEKDPIIIAQKNYYTGPRYLIGRWGPELESMAALTAKAKARLLPTVKAQAAKIEAEAAAIGKVAEECVDMFLSGGGQEGVIPTLTLGDRL